MKNKIKRCGTCLFAEGGDKVEFENDDINYKYNCDLIERKDNIVLLEYNEDIVWENQRACKDYEPATSTLKKRIDLDKIEYHFQSEGHFEILGCA